MCKVVKMKIGDRNIRVADIKKKYIRNIVDAASQCDLIDRIVLFGSSVRDSCKEESDIDLAIFGNQTEYRALRSKKYDRFTSQIYSFDDSGQSYDLLYFVSGKQYRGLIMDDIENGELIYARH
ncbi:MAG: nucleotidyltransferase domain-containing protein [Lachnospiraceae bacterium]|nr:nucleotidyltransferase domain-containing protein [Lachnospiraceae bacterium]